MSTLDSPNCTAVVWPLTETVSVTSSPWDASSSVEVHSRATRCRTHRILPCALVRVITSEVHLVARHLFAGPCWLCKPVHGILHRSYSFVQRIQLLR
eukprot:COSAG02_NODE_3348_length_6900_cov_2.993082_2_plen_97_part_00